MAQIVQMNPASEAYRQQLFRQIANLPPDVRAFITDQYADGQITVLPLPYWSRMRFQGARAAGPPITVTIPASTRSSFSYAQGQDMTIAGFTGPARVATLSDTNLLRPSETRDNADVWIWGVCAYITPASEPVLAGRVVEECAVTLALNGTQSVPLGRVEMFPAAGGLYGSGKTFLKAPATNEAGPGVGDNGGGAGWSFLNNGNPMSGSFFRLPQPFKWSSIGTAGSDSSLVLTAAVTRAIVEETATRAAVPVVAMVTPGTIEPFTAPAANGDPGTFVDIVWRLICVAVSKRSVNI